MLRQTALPPPTVQTHIKTSIKILREETSLLVCPVHAHYVICRTPNAPINKQPIPPQQWGGRERCSSISKCRIRPPQPKTHTICPPSAFQSTMAALNSRGGKSHGQYKQSTILKLDRAGGGERNEGRAGERPRKNIYEAAQDSSSDNHYLFIP